MKQLTILANIIAKEDKVDLVKAELLKLIDITRSELGCINYDLHQDNDNSSHFMLYENWQTRELWQLHMAKPHLTEFMANTSDSVEDIRINEMSVISD